MCGFSVNINIKSSTLVLNIKLICVTVSSGHRYPWEIPVIQRTCPWSAATLRSLPLSSCGIWWRGHRRQVCSSDRSRRPSSQHLPGRHVRWSWWQTGVLQSLPERERAKLSQSTDPAQTGQILQDTGTCYCCFSKICFSKDRIAFKLLIQHQVFTQLLIITVMTWRLFGRCFFLSQEEDVEIKVLHNRNHLTPETCSDRWQLSKMDNLTLFCYLHLNCYSYLIITAVSQDVIKYLRRPTCLCYQCYHLMLVWCINKTRE